MNIWEAKETFLEMKKAISNLQIISWDEIFEFVPESDEVKEDIDVYLEKLRHSVEDLEGFF